MNERDKNTLKVLNGNYSPHYVDKLLKKGKEKHKALKEMAKIDAPKGKDIKR